MKTIKKIIKKIMYYIIACLLLLIESPIALFACIAWFIDFISTILTDIAIKLQDDITIFNRKLKAKFAMK